MPHAELERNPEPRHVGNFEVKDKICLVTGGGSGINLAFVRLAHSQGAKVLIADTRLLPEAQDFINDANTGKEATVITFLKTDVRDWSQLHALVEKSKEDFGAVPDVYIGGAGLFEPDWANFWDDNEDEAGRYAQVDVNVSHCAKLTRIAMRALLGENKKGVVLFVGSTTGLTGSYTVPLYAATKAALIGFTKSLGPADRLEGVKVACVCPPPVNTPLWDDKRDTAYGKILEQTISPAQTAESMMQAITSGKYKGGSIIEILRTEQGKSDTALLDTTPPDEHGKVRRGVQTMEDLNTGGDIPEIFDPFRVKIVGERYVS